MPFLCVCVSDIFAHSDADKEGAVIPYAKWNKVEDVNIGCHTKAKPRIHDKQKANMHLKCGMFWPYVYCFFVLAGKTSKM